MVKGLVAAATAMALLAGCVEEESVSVPPDACGAGELAYLVGQPASALETIRFAGPVRFIRPGTAVTMDMNPERLNIRIDAAERIDRVSCG